MDTALFFIFLFIVIAIVSFVVKIVKSGVQYKQITETNYNKYTNIELSVTHLVEGTTHIILIDTNNKTVFFDKKPWFKWIHSCNERYSGWKFEDFEHELKSCILCPLSCPEPQIVIYYVNTQGNVINEIFKINNV